jgi:hypothetical protein
MPVKGSYLLLTGGGAVVIWAGLKGKQPGSVLRALISGKPLGSAVNTSPGGGGSGGSGFITGNVPNALTLAAYKAYALTMLTAHGWPNQFPALNSIVMAESGWYALATNQASGAFGIGQALGHGNAHTAGTHGNNYGNFGTSDAVCKLANNGNGDAQIQWMLNYIGAKYGNPNNAWAFHQANGYYLWPDIGVPVAVADVRPRRLPAAKLLPVSSPVPKRYAVALLRGKSVANTATVIIVVAGTTTFANEWWQTKVVNWRIPIATALLAAAFDGLAHLDSGAATGLALMALLGAATVKFNGHSAADTISGLFASGKGL